MNDFCLFFLIKKGVLKFNTPYIKQPNGWNKGGVYQNLEQYFNNIGMVFKPSRKKILPSSNVKLILSRCFG